MPDQLLAMEYKILIKISLAYAKKRYANRMAEGIKNVLIFMHAKENLKA